MTRFAVASTLLLLSSTTTVSAQTQQPRDGGNGCRSITDIACGSSDFQVLCEALHVTKLDVALESGEWTVFAPTDAAFATLSDDILDPMRTFRDNLEYLILTHAIPAQVVLSTDLDCGSEWEMASQHETTTVTCRNNNNNHKFIAGQGNTPQDTPKVVDADLPACNGVIHVLDKVILPGDLPIMPGKPDYCPYCPKPPPPTKPPALPPTYAPTEYYAPPKPQDPYYPPQQPYYPPPPQPYYPPYDPNPYKPQNPHKNPNYPHPDPYAPYDPYKPKPSPPKKPLEYGHCETISDVICGADGFAVLCDALKVTGLYTALKHNQHYTLFAPTDTAFYQLLGTYHHGDFTKEELTHLLLYHVIHSKYDSWEYDELECDTWIQMASGDYSFTLCRSDVSYSSYHAPPQKAKKYQLGAGNSPMNEPELILTAAKGSVCNGVIHVVDNVLLPDPKLWDKYHGDVVKPGK